MLLKIRRCLMNDLGLLTEISKKTFVEAFKDANDPDDFEHYIKTAFSKLQIKKELENPNSKFYFIHDKDNLVGYFKLNSKTAQTEFQDQNSFELERIYVCKEFQGKKIGKWMLQEALKMASSSDKEFMWLGVWQKNTRAIEFYERYGFKKIGTHPYFIGSDEQTDWLMKYSLEN